MRTDWMPVRELGVVAGGLEMVLAVIPRRETLAGDVAANEESIHTGEAAAD
jgi:hypothetical protein